MHQKVHVALTTIAAVLLLLVYLIPIWTAIIVFDLVGIWWVVVAMHLPVVLLLIMQYAYGKQHALQAVGATEIKEGPLIESAKEISEEMGVNTPKVYVGNFGMYNAFVVGRKNKGRVVLSEKLISDLSHEQIESVLAHEISHLKSHDTTLMVLGEGIDGLLLQTKRDLLQGSRGIGSFLVAFPVVIVLVLARGLVLLPLRLISRRREYLADRDASEVTSEFTVAKTLEDVHNNNVQLGSYPQRAAEVDALCIDGVVDSFLNKILGTHPPMKRRIRRLVDS